MKIIKTSNFNKKTNEQWDYKGYKCKIILEHEEDNIKAFHEVTSPSGERIFANINPYDNDVETVNLWIDAGMPENAPDGGWRKEDLIKLTQEDGQDVQPDSNHLNFGKEDNRGLGGFASNYFNIEKVSQYSGDENHGDNITSGEFEEPPMPARKDKEYFASIGVRIRVASGNPQQELMFAQQAFEAMKEQITSGVHENGYEAWLSDNDDEPQTISQIMNKKP